jgi:hypothetical protein
MMRVQKDRNHRGHGAQFEASSPFSSKDCPMILSISKLHVNWNCSFHELIELWFLFPREKVHRYRSSPFGKSRERHIELGIYFFWEGNSKDAWIVTRTLLEPPWSMREGRRDFQCPRERIIAAFSRQLEGTRGTDICFSVVRFLEPSRRGKHRWSVFRF